MNNVVATSLLASAVFKIEESMEYVCVQVRRTRTWMEANYDVLTVVGMYL